MFFIWRYTNISLICAIVYFTVCHHIAALLRLTFECNRKATCTSCFGKTHRVKHKAILTPSGWQRATRGQLTMMFLICRTLMDNTAILSLLVAPRLLLLSSRRLFVLNVGSRDMMGFRPETLRMINVTMVFPISITPLIIYLVHQFLCHTYVMDIVCMACSGLPKWFNCGED
jgi:hypothetical protein